MKKEKRITAHVTQETKEAIIKAAKDTDRSESYIAGKILNEAFTPTTKAKENK